MRTISTFVIATLTALTLSACVVVSEHPLSDPRKGEHDESLLGGWSTEDLRFPIVRDDTPVASDVYVSVTRKDNRLLLGTFAVVDGELNHATYGAHVTSIGTSRYLTLYHLKKDQQPDPILFYLIVKYDIDKEGALLIYPLDPSCMEAAVKNGKVEGKIEEGNVLLEEEPEALRAFIAGLEEADFAAPVRFFRAKVPVLQE